MTLDVKKKKTNCNTCGRKLCSKIKGLNLNTETSPTLILYNFKINEFRNSANACSDNV